uniref:EAL domain-containing protein n=1 Tax=Anopheles coluzzii TaxID=1518534 RepID=A0A8W7P2M4_ANOCL
MKRFEHAGLTLGSHFQPIYSLAHRRTVGVEALLRAEQNQLPLSPAEAFYAMVSPERRHGLDLAVTCHGAGQLHSRGRPATRQCGTGSAGHVLEVDEALIEGVNLLKKAGFLIAIDDFGVGHSNLDRVCQLEPDLVKFDKDLLRSAVSQPRTRNLLSRLVRLMHEIGALVASKPKTTYWWRWSPGCDLVQGYYVARPGLTPDPDDIITKRLDSRWDELMVRDLLKRKITRRQIELARQAFVQSAISLMQGTPFDQAATPMLAMPDVIRCFLLDSEGRQIGRNLNSRHNTVASNLKFAPLADTT